MSIDFELCCFCNNCSILDVKNKIYSYGKAAITISKNIDPKYMHLMNISQSNQQTFELKKCSIIIYVIDVNIEK